MLEFAVRGYRVVFPAYAGMNRNVFPSAQIALRVPRIRGDEPGVAEMGWDSLMCSPHTRG